MLFTSPIPLQETLNAVYLQGQGTGILCESATDIGREARLLAADPGILQRMVHACQRMSSPDAASEIARRALGRQRDLQGLIEAPLARPEPVPFGRD